MKALLTRALCLFLLLTTPFIALSQELDKSLWLVWQQNSPLSNSHINHKPWQQFIDKYLSDDNQGLRRIYYEKVSKKDFMALKHYLKHMANIKISRYNRNEQLAYWLNVYNAIAIKLVLENYPIDTIQDINISPGLFSSGPWEANQITIEKSPISLFDIRNRIVRPIWNDPRTLYAMHTTALGGANLYHEAFNGDRVNEQLSQAAYEYINSKRGVNIIKHQLVVSKIYEWYVQDFGGTQQSVISHLRQFAKSELKKQLQSIKTITEYTYNWHLNKAS